MSCEGKKFSFLLHQDPQNDDRKIPFFTDSYEKCSRRVDGGLFSDEGTRRESARRGNDESTQSPFPLS